jgi:hypothetical protein
MSSFRLIKDQQVTSLDFESGNAPLTRCTNINYLDNWATGATLVAGDPFKVQLVSIGNIVTFSWNTVVVTANGSGPVVNLDFATKIPAEYLPALIGTLGQGQNYPVYIGDSTMYLIWINTDGTINIDPTDTNTFIADTSLTATVWGSTITWTTNNA